MLPKLTRRLIGRTLLAAIVVVALGAWFASWYYSFDQRFARSKAALDAYAAQVLAGDPSVPLVVPRRIGAFDTSHGFRLPHGFAFAADYGHPLDWNGLAYSTEPLPRDLPDTRPPFSKMYFTPVEGNWYKVDRN